MPTKLVLAPAAGGKTQYAIDRIREVSAQEPLTTVRVVVPDRNQGTALQHRLAERGAIGVRVGTFFDLYKEILTLGAEPFPVAPEPVIHRLVRAAIDRIAQRGRLVHYEPIRRRPGLVTVLARLFAELKRSQINPQRFAEAMSGRGARLEELAALYEEYQASLVKLNWSDHEGLGWLAVDVLNVNLDLTTGWRLVVVDGFDSFNPTQLELLEALRPRIDELLITLTGDIAMSRLAYRRFGRTLERLSEHLRAEIQSLPTRRNPIPALAHLEAGLFQSDATVSAASSGVTFLEAQNTTVEAREALRWIKARVVRDGVKVDECAILARDISLYRSALREAASEFGLPLRLACGEPLASNPAVAAVLNLLELPLQNWARRPLLDVLRTPYFDLSPFGFARDDASLLDETARAGQVIGGIDQWREALVPNHSEVATVSALALAADEKDALIDDLYGEEARPPRRPTGAAALALMEHLDSFHQRMMPPERGSLTEYVRWLEELISTGDGVNLMERLASQVGASGTAPAGIPGVSSRNYQELLITYKDKAAMKKLAETLAALVLGEAVVGSPAELTYTEFCAELRALIDNAVYRPDEIADHNIGQVYAVDLDGARGVCYRAVALIGLSEGLFPSTLHEGPLLSDEEREDCAQAGLALEPALRSDQQTLFYEGVTRATEFLLLSRPYLADDGELWEPSPYWAAARALFEAQPLRIRPEDVRSHYDAASPAELLAWCVRRRSLPGTYGELRSEWETLRHHGQVLRARLNAKAGGDYEGELAGLAKTLSARFGPGHGWSASSLETYASCPFYFFTHVALGLEERKPPALDFDAAQLGLMLHEILEKVYRQASDKTSLDELLTALPSIAQTVFANAPKEYGFRPSVLWQTRQRELMDSLSRTLAALVERNGQFRPAHFERKFGLEGEPPLIVPTDDGPVLFRGVIDRVDLDQNRGVRVIDYKTGSSDLHARDLIEGRRLQLAIYSLAASSLQLGMPVDGFYWAVLKGEISQLQLRNFSYETSEGRTYYGPRGAIDLAIGHIVSYLNGIKGGLFAPLPSSRGCKQYCPARLFCWRYEPASW